MNCKKCSKDIDDDSKFCSFCGEKIIINEEIFVSKLGVEVKEKYTSELKSILEKNNEETKDISWLFLPFGLFIGMIFELYDRKLKLGVENISIFNFFWKIMEKAPGEFFALLFGGGLARILIPTIIIGFIWIVMRLMSKKYEKPILHIFIGSILISLILLTQNK